MRNLLNPAAEQQQQEDGALMSEVNLVDDFRCFAIQILSFRFEDFGSFVGHASSSFWNLYGRCNFIGTWRKFSNRIELKVSFFF